MSTAADYIAMPGNRRSHSSAACMRLLSQFMVDVDGLHPLMSDVDVTGPDADQDRFVIERLAGALWGVFSHYRAVVDRDGRHYDLGSWRAGAEFIADLANGHYPTLNPPIRYLDCYMGVLLGEEHKNFARPLHRWIFSRLQAAGCEWIYAFSADASTEDRRARRRELSAALSQAYEDNAEHGVHAPTPAVIAAYQDVYGHLPEGWPL